MLGGHDYAAGAVHRVRAAQALAALFGLFAAIFSTGPASAQFPGSTMTEVSSLENPTGGLPHFSP
jgi:hypothetical protein